MTMSIEKTDNWHAWSVLDESVLPTGSFHRMVLISHRDQLDRPGIGDADTIVVTTDYLCWALLRRDGIPCAHFESLLGQWPVEAGDPNGLFVDYADWMMDGIRDLSAFQGVSLGRLFNVSVGFVARAWLRMHHGLDRLIARFTPHEIVLYDVYPEFGMLEPETRHRLVADLAQAHGAALIDRFEPLAIGEGFLSEIDYDACEPQESGWRPRLRAGFSAMVDRLTALRSALSRRPRVFIIHNWNTLSALLNACPGRSIGAAVNATWVPKTLNFVARCLRDDIRLMHVPNLILNEREKAEVTTIELNLRRKLEQPTDGARAAVRDFLLARILSGADLARSAIQVKTYRRMLTRLRPQRVLVGDIGNHVCRTIAEAAATQGAAVDELVNGMFITPMRWDARTGAPDQSPLVDRHLVWGRQQEDWLRLIGAPSPSVRTGYPALDAFPPRQLPVTGRNALLLPLSTECGDTTALRANIMSSLVQFAGALTSAGWHVRVKLHPGRTVAAYYKEVLTLAGIEAEVTKVGPLTEHLAWADIVIGPLNSGAFVESLAYGRPFYGIHPEPSSVLPELWGNTSVHAHPDTLLKCLAAPKQNVSETLEYLCERTPGPAAPRVWEALEKGSQRA